MSLKTTLKAISSSAVLLAENLLRGKRPPPNPDQVQSVLILEYLLPLGCCVHLTPLFQAIKQSRPEVTVIVATRALGYSLLRHNPFVDHLIETPDPLVDLPAAARALARELTRRHLKPDCTLTGIADQRTRIALLSLLCGAGWRGGFTQSPQLYQRPLQPDPTLSHIDNNLRLAVLAGCSTTHIEPAVFFSLADISVARALVAQANPEGKPLLVFVTQNSGGQSTAWHMDRFVQVIRHAHRALGCNIVYVGTPTDTPAVEALRIEAGGIGTSFAGRTSITELAALLALSDCLVSIDTGTVHVGRAVGIPLVILGPSWQKPLEWLPLNISNARILRGPDRTDVPPNYKLDEVNAAQVIAALEQLLTLYPPDPASRSARLARYTSTTEQLS